MSPLWFIISPSLHIAFCLTRSTVSCRHSPSWENKANAISVSRVFFKKCVQHNTTDSCFFPNLSISCTVLTVNRQDGQDSAVLHIHGNWRKMPFIYHSSKESFHSSWEFFHQYYHFLGILSHFLRSSRLAWCAESSDSQGEIKITGYGSLNSAISSENICNIGT